MSDSCQLPCDVWFIQLHVPLPTEPAADPWQPHIPHPGLPQPQLSRALPLLLPSHNCLMDLSDVKASVRLENTSKTIRPLTQLHHIHTNPCPQVPHACVSGTLPGLVTPRALGSLFLVLDNLSVKAFLPIPPHTSSGASWGHSPHLSLITWEKGLTPPGCPLPSDIPMLSKY